MNMIKTLLATAVISFAAIQAQAHSPAACPNLSGDYVTEDGKQRMTIAVTNVQGGVTYSFGEGSNPVTADGASHPIDTGTYVASCENAKVLTVVSINGSAVLTFSHTQINAKGDIRAVSTGMDVSDIIWLKK